jgi:hypothetical protein
MDVGKIIVLAVSLAIAGSLMVSTVFTNYSAANYTGILAIVMPFVPVIFGVGLLYVAMKELGIGK